MEKISDSRLTPTMERIRSGSKQLFREKDPQDRTFIDESNADLILVHPKKEMYASLIDGEWYWVSGCQECNGLPRNTAKSYIECEEHDRCRSCGIKSKDYSGVKWGGVYGWTCQPCKDAQDQERRRAAFEKLDGELPDTYHTDSPVCPHCGTEHTYDSGDEEIECYVCNGRFSIRLEVVTYFTTEVIGERITE